MIKAIYLEGLNLIYILVFSIVYFFKRQYNFIESKVYKYLLVVTLLQVIVYGIKIYLLYNLNVGNVYLFTLFHFVLLFIWFILFALYVLLSRSNTKYDKFGELFKVHSKFYTWFFVTIALFAFLVIIQLAFNIFTLNNSIYRIIYLFGLVISLVVLFNVIFDNNDVATYKNYSIIASVLILVAAIFAQVFCGNLIIDDIFIVNFSLSLVTLFQYFTIENPDLKYADEVNALKVKAENANNAKTDFLASMSHEIRTPMNVIVGLSENLLTSNIPNEYKEDINNINEASNTLLEIINNILDISKVESGKMVLNNAPYSLANIVAKLTNIVKTSLSDKTVSFSVQVNGKIPKTLKGDETKLCQILTNILSNSVKYTNTGSIKLVINSVISGNKDNLTFKVIDTGMGIRKGDMTKLFHEFERLDQEKSDIQGSGLGLVITKKLVDLMDGKISLDSVYQEGTTFTVSLVQDIIDNEIIDLVNYQAKKEAIDNYFDGSKYRILIVDDNLLNLKVAEKFLKKYNFQIVSAKSGLECLNITKNNVFDLIFLDHMMPEMDGLQTLYNLKRRASGFDTPVVVLTANAIEGSKDMYLREGFCDYLSKPINQMELDRILRQYLKINDNQVSVNSNESVIDKGIVSNNINNSNGHDFDKDLMSKTVNINSSSNVVNDNNVSANVIFNNNDVVNTNNINVNNNQS